MNKRLVSVLVIIGLLVLGGLLWMNSGEQQQIPQPATSNTKPQSNTTPSQKQEAGSYEEYSEAKLAQTTGTKILFFHASWCPQCRALEADINKSGVPAGTTIFKVDYDKAQDLRKKYGVTLQTTVVKVDDNGKLISKFTPYQKPTLQNALENL